MTTKTILWFLRIGPMALIVCALLELPAWSDIWTAPSLTVDVAGGGQFTGQPDPRSDGDWLWLRIGRPSAYVVRPVAWDRVVQATHAGVAVSVDRLREDILAMEGVAPLAGDTKTATQFFPERMSPPASAVTSAQPPVVLDLESAPRRPTLPVRRPRVASIRADAWAANWDADVENDGIVVQVLAYDARGDAVPVSGRLDVTLFGPRVRSNQSALRRGDRLDRLGQWTRRVEPPHGHDTEMTYRLPYRVTNPQFDTRLGSHALVNVRLSVPGSGVFERTIDYVRIQPFSPLRDYQQLHTGRRWLDIEQTGREKRGPTGF